MDHLNLDLEVKTPVFSYTRKELETILSFHDRTVKDSVDDVETILNWLKTQPHLPTPYPSNRMILNLLIRNKFSIEKTKQKVDAYYTIRTVMAELYENRFPKGEDMVYIRRFAKGAVLPKLANYNRVFVTYIDEKDLKYDSDSYLAYMMIYMELFNMFDISNKIDVILDSSNVTLNNMKPIGVTFLKKIVTIMEKVFSNRINAIRFVYLPNYAVVLVNLLRSLVPKKLKAKIYIHNSFEELHEFYSKDILPSDFGGNGDSLVKLCDDLEELAQRNLEHFKIFQNIKTIESLRPKKLDNDEFLGYHGNFKKLEVD